MKICKKEIGDLLIDAHTHCGFNPWSFYNIKYPSLQHATFLSQLIKKNDIAFAITFPMSTTLYYDIELYSQGIFKQSNFGLFPFEKENLYLLSEIKSFNLKNIIPFCSISLNDKVDEQISNIENLLKTFDVYGLKFHPRGDCNCVKIIDKYPKLLNLLEENNLPLMVHTGLDKFSNPLYVLEMAKKYPNIRFCAAHLAKFILKFFEEIDRDNFDNLFIDMSPFIGLCKRRGVESKNRNEILDLDYGNISEIFDFFTTKYIDKVIWGTDAPWLNVSDLIKFYDDDFITYQDEVKILTKNKLIAKKIANANTVKFLFG